MFILNPQRAYSPLLAAESFKIPLETLVVLSHGSRNFLSAPAVGGSGGKDWTAW
jgi:hypothetical protein